MPPEVFETAPFDRSGTSPCKRRRRLSTGSARMAGDGDAGNRPTWLPALSRDRLAIRRTTTHKFRRLSRLRAPDDAFVNKLFDNRPAAAFGSSTKGLAFVLDGLIPLSVRIY